MTNAANISSRSAASGKAALPVLIFRVITLVALALASIASRAQPQMAVPWSQLSRTFAEGQFSPPLGGASVTVISAQDGSAGVAIPGVLFKPAGTPRGAVVIVNSAAGWSDSREGNYGRALSSAGYAVLAIDTYGPRGISATQADNTKLSTYAQMRDAFAARRYLVSAGYPADRIAIMGTGRGGTIALLAADRTFMQDEQERFAVAMAITAGCMFHPREPKPGASIFLAVADRDDITGVKPCQNLADEYAAVGGKVTVKVYSGTSNGFDGHPTIIQMFHDPVSETFMDCKVLVEPDGRSTYNGKSFAESDSSALFMEMRKSCIKHGGSGWTNPTRKANLTLDLIEFLDANLRR